MQKKKESKTRTITLNCRNVEGGWNLSIHTLLNPFAPMAWVLQSFRNQETNPLLLLQTDIYRPCMKNYQ
jgi:hypothetical protein